MDDLVFCSLAFGKEYIQQQARLRESIRRAYPKANMIFLSDRFPEGSRPFSDSLYGFKPHLALEALNQGFKRVVLLDPAMILVGLVGKFLHFPVVAVKDTSVLHNVISNKTCAYYNITRAQIQRNGWHLVGGSFYYFDFHTPIAHNVFKTWITAEREGLFGSQKEAASEQLQGHRYDETLMALAMYFHDIEPQDPDQVGYCISENSVWQKRHFK